MSARGPAPVSAREDVARTIDAVRGVAILMVIWYHGLSAWYSTFGWQAVHVFVVLSGFVLTLSAARKGDDAAWGAWWRKRMRRILPAYWVTVVLGVLAVVLLDMLGRNVEFPLRRVFLTGALDLALLQNFSYMDMLANPNTSLWFVPFIAGFYLQFRVLFRPIMRLSHGGLIALVIVTAVLEAAIRGMAIAWLDGMPVGYGHGFLEPFGEPPGPLDLRPRSFPFQLWAPFGLFPTRLGEFVLGMAAARLYLSGPAAFSARATGPGAFVAGLAVWGLGNALVYAGRPGWLIADWLLALGLGLLLPPLAALAERRLPLAARFLALTGRWSLPLFLIHMPVLYVYVRFYPLWMDSLPVSAAMLLVALAAVVGATWALGSLDRSPLLDRAFGVTRGARKPA